MRQSKLLEKMRLAVEWGDYVVTPHALLEMRKDGLDIIDVESAILTGKIEKEFREDPRGPRYEVIGTACDVHTEVGVVVRFAGPMLIITVYEIR